MYEFFKHNIEKRSDLIFYEVTEEEIINAQDRMGIKFPKSLYEFYSEIGYGFVKGSPNFINRIMAPADIADFVCNNDVYSYVDRSIYNRNEFVFMHIADEDFLTIEYVNGREGAIKYFSRKIAETYMEFLERMLQDPNYYIKK